MIFIVIGCLFFCIILFSILSTFLHFPPSWKIRDFARYYHVFHELCYYNKLTHSGGEQCIYTLLKPLPDKYSDAIEVWAAHDVYQHYIAYIASVTYSDRDSFSLGSNLKRLKDPCSTPFRELYFPNGKIEVCLAVTFCRFIQEHVSSNLYRKTHEYKIAAHGMHLAAMMMLNLLGYEYDTADTKRRLDDLLAGKEV